MGTTSILYGLRSEKEVFGGGVIVGSILRCAIFVGGFADGIFEKEYNAVDGRELAEIIGIESDQFFKLYIFDTKVIEEKCKDSLKGEKVSCLFANHQKQYLWFLRRQIQLDGIVRILVSFSK